MSNLETLLECELRSQLIFQQQLKSLSAYRKQLQETKRQHVNNLEKRIHQDALLSKKVFSDTTQHTDYARYVFFKLIRPNYSEVFCLLLLLYLPEMGE